MNRLKFALATAAVLIALLLIGNWSYTARPDLHWFDGTVWYVTMRMPGLFHEDFESFPHQSPQWIWLMHVDHSAFTLYADRMPKSIRRNGVDLNEREVRSRCRLKRLPKGVPAVHDPECIPFYY